MANEEKEVVVEETIITKEVIKKPKKEKDEDEKSLTWKILNVITWAILIVWMIICVVDFMMVRSEKKPIFCLSRTTNTYDDGNVEICTGLGYKTFNYKRKSYKAIEFGPFWSKDRSAEKDTK